VSVLLEARSATKRFGGVHALADVSFAIEAGQIYGLIGPNGAGKTTLFNLLTGIYAPDAGSFNFAGRSLSGLRPDRVAAAGIARTFQNIRLFANLAALENVMIGRHADASGVVAVLRTRRTLQEERDIERRALQLLEYVGIRARANDAGATALATSAGSSGARARHRAEAAGARRAGGRHGSRPSGSRSGRPDQAHPRRRRHDPADRARRALA
jgi:ABC-type branched-subunit amino acid transport system ATPase component